MARSVDTKTRFVGVYARHKLRCALAEGRLKCTCKASFYGVAWDKQAGRNRKTKFRPRAIEARNLREDLMLAIRRREIVGPAGLTIEEGHERFVAAARAGIALNKKGRPYKPRAVVDLDGCLSKLPISIRNTDLRELRRGEVQQAVDGFNSAGLSGSRIRSIVNSLRSLYRWAEDRELVTEDPAADVRLPAIHSERAVRVATPAEFAALLAVLKSKDALPFALAAYGTARAQEIRHLRWEDVEIDEPRLLLAEDDHARKSDAARRTVPVVAPLEHILRAEARRQGNPRKGLVCPARRRSESGKIALGSFQKRVFKVWREHDLEPIGLQDSRHTAATWLDHAGVSPKVASQFMGHSTPEAQIGAARITLGRYTHLLEGELDRAREQLDAFLLEREGA
jgi:integrase